MAVEQCLKKLISQLDGDLLYIEVGVLRATNLVTIAKEQPRVRKLIGIDNYRAYKDSMHGNYVVTETMSRYNRSIAEKKIAESGCAERIELLIEDSEVAVKQFSSASIDIVFLDKNLKYEETVLDVRTWYEKTKNNGILCGHEGWERQIIEAVLEGLSKVAPQLSVEIINDEVWWIQKPKITKERH